MVFFMNNEKQETTIKNKIKKNILKNKIKNKEKYIKK
jgi:hypothetical protein